MGTRLEKAWGSEKRRLQELMEQAKDDYVTKTYKQGLSLNHLYDLEVDIFFNNRDPKLSRLGLLQDEEQLPILDLESTQRQVHFPGLDLWNKITGLYIPRTLGRREIPLDARSFPTLGTPERCLVVGRTSIKTPMQIRNE
jgi:hypothetical protein